MDVRVILIFSITLGWACIGSKSSGGYAGDEDLDELDSLIERLALVLKEQELLERGYDLLDDLDETPHATHNVKRKKLVKKWGSWGGGFSSTKGEVHKIGGSNNKSRFKPTG